MLKRLKSAKNADSVHTKKNAWEGENKQMTTNGWTLQLLDKIGPVGRFGEKYEN